MVKTMLNEQEKYNDEDTLLAKLVFRGGHIACMTEVPHGAARCSTLSANEQHGATRCNTLCWVGATRCNTVLHGARSARCNTVQHGATRYRF
jgi:hypothetical protein